MFASTGDDKALRVWDYGVPITVKYVCEPWMHSMPAATMSPNGNYVAYQCLDNSILCYNADDPKYKVTLRNTAVLVRVDDCWSWPGGWVRGVLSLGVRWPHFHAPDR